MTDTEREESVEVATKPATTKSAAAGSGELDRLRIELEAFAQRQFERERYIAWQAGEVERANRRAAEAERAAAASAAQLSQVLRSTSWRIALPFRVLRRPGLYARRLAGK